jgi:hypothetical protein
MGEEHLRLNPHDNGIGIVRWFEITEEKRPGATLDVLDPETGCKQSNFSEPIF